MTRGGIPVEARARSRAAESIDYRLADEPRRHAAERPDHPACSDGVTTLTYAQLDDRTNRLAQLLRSLGIGPGARVAVLDKSSVEVLEVLLGAAKLGAVTVPLNWRLAPPELVSVATDAGVAALIAHRDFAAAAAHVVSAMEAPLPLVTIGDDYETRLAQAEPIDPGHRGEADDVILQIYTSGTTGDPKGVLSTNRNLAACSGTGGPWGFDGSSVSLCAMPMFHIGGLGWALVGLRNGAHNVIVRDVHPPSLLDTIERMRITNAFLVPTVIGMLVDLPGAAERYYDDLRSIAYGSSPITPALLRRALETFRRPLFQLYGLTETHGAITQLDADDHDPGGPREYLLRSAGRAYPWVELRIRDLQDGGDAAVGQPGEICIRGPQNTLGYHNRPKETAELIDAEGWLHTGDIGSVDKEGYLTISDRLKDMIITGGENVYPVEVEAVLAEHPAVGSVAVVGRPDERWGEVVTAVVVVAANQSLDERELIAFARERLAAYKCPKRVEVVHELPLGPTGKIVKRELRGFREAAR